MTEQQRSTIYSLCTAIAAVVVVYGVATKEQAAAVVALVPALLATVTAFWHRPTKLARKAARTKIGDAS